MYLYAKYNDSNKMHNFVFDRTVHRHIDFLKMMDRMSNSQTFSTGHYYIYNCRYKYSHIYFLLCKVLKVYLIIFT